MSGQDDLDKSGSHYQQSRGMRTLASRYLVPAGKCFTAISTLGCICDATYRMGGREGLFAPRDAALSPESRVGDDLDLQNNIDTLVLRN